MYKQYDEQLKHEVQKRIQIEEKLHRIMLAIKSLSECNHALVHINDEKELMNVVCKSIVNTGGYRLAWVGFAERDDKKTVKPVAYAGYEEGYLEKANITWGNDEYGQSPAGIAIRTGTPCIVKNTLTDPSFDPWCSEVLKRRYASSIALPLIVNNVTFGALSIYAGEPDAFNSDVRELFHELANDLAFRIETIRIRAAKEKAEKELEKSEVYFRSIIESLQDSVTVFDYDGTIRYRNSGFGDTSGYRPEDLIGKTALKFIHPDDRQRVIEDFTNGIKIPGKTTVSEFRYRFKDGSWHVLEAQIRNLHDMPEVKGVVVNSRDITKMKQAEGKLRTEITERKKTEEALKTSEDRFRAMVQNSSDIISVMDEHGILKYVSPSIERLLGYVPGDRIGKSALDLLHPDDIEMTLKAVSDILAYPDHPYAIEIRYLHADGVYRNFEIRGSNQLNNTSINGIVGIGRDVTEHKQTESNLKEEMEITTNLLMLSEAAAHITDVDKLMEKVVKSSRRIMGCDISLSYLRNKESGAFMPSSQIGLPNKIVPIFNTEPLSAEIIKKYLDLKKPVLVSLNMPYSSNDISMPIIKIEDTDSGKWPLFNFSSDIKAAVIVPLTNTDEYLGLIVGMYATQDAGRFTDRYRKMMVGISNQVSTALDQARLYRESVEKTMEFSNKIETISMMHEIGKSILSTVQSQGILDSMTRMAGKIVPCDAAGVAIVDVDREGFLYEAGFGAESLQKDSFIKFRDTSATDIIRTGRPQYIAKLSDMKGLLPFEKNLLHEGVISLIRIPMKVKEEIIGVLSLGSKRSSAFMRENLLVLENFADQISVALSNARLLTDLEDLFIGTIKSLSTAIEAKSAWIAGHSERVTKYAVMIGEELGLDEKMLKNLKIAGILHDIGKIGTYSILDKTAKFTDKEIELIRGHAAKGAEILSPIKQLKDIVPAVKYHHEAFNGTGYPEGLRG